MTAIHRRPHAARAVARQVLVLHACLFVVMVGYGSTLTVLPYHTQRIGALATSTRREPPVRGSSPAAVIRGRLRTHRTSNP